MRYLRDLGIGLIAGAIAAIRWGIFGVPVGIAIGTILVAISFVADRQRHQLRDDPAEWQRLRNLRSRLGLIRSEAMAIRATIFQTTESRRYWNPDERPFRLMRFEECGGELSTDADTSAAHIACSDLDRELARVGAIASRRWEEWVAAQELDPPLKLRSPRVLPEDHLEGVLGAVRRAVKELDASAKRIDRRLPR